MTDQPCPRCRGARTLPIHTMSGPPPPCHLCHQSGRVGPTRWLQSPYDGEVHAFFGGVEAGCGHSTPVDKQAIARPGAVPCRQCLAVVGTALVEQDADPARWSP